MTQKQHEQLPYFSGIAALLGSLIYQLKVLLLFNPKIPISNPLLSIEKAKECWLSGNELDTLSALQEARDRCDFTQKQFDLTVQHQLIDDIASLLENNDKTDTEKNRIVMLLWLKTIQSRPFVYYIKQVELLRRPLVQYRLRLFATIVMNLFILFACGQAMYALIQLWQISLFSFVLLCLISAGCLLLFKAFPNIFFVFLPGFVPLIIFFVLAISHGSDDVLPGVLYYLFFMVSLMILLINVAIIRSHFQSARYGKLSYMCLRCREENEKRVWESVIVDTNGNIVKVCKSRFRSRVTSPFLTFSSSVGLVTSKKDCKRLETFCAWQIFPLFLSTPSKRMPKTSGFAWWVKSNGLWFVDSEALFSRPFSWEYKEDKTCSFTPLNEQSNPTLWKHGKKAGIKFSDEEIAEFLSRLPSPLQDPPGYAEYVASHGIEER